MKYLLALAMAAWSLIANASPGQPYFVRKLSSLPANLCTAIIGDGTPTNIVGYPAYTWWVAQCGLSTNGANNEQYLLDLTGNGLTCTNSSDKGGWLRTETNALNGFSVFAAPGNGNSTWTYTPAYTNSGAAELVFVSNITNSVGMEEFFCMAKASQSDTVSRGGWIISSSLKLYAGSFVASCNPAPLTNRWVVYNFVFNGASSTIYTNNVAGASGNPGANAGNGIFLFCDSQAAGNPFSGKTAEIITYRTNLSDAARTTLFTYLTNKYNLSP